jgi:hypothetical protein
VTIRPPDGFPLPELVVVSNRVLSEEAEALRAAMEQFGSMPQPGSPWSQDDEAVADRADPVAQARATVLRHARHQASLIYVNAWDHLITLARVLGGDGAMPLFSQASVSRVICEAAVRFAWLMDPDISSAKRLVRGAVALYFSAEERSRGVRALPAERFDPRIYRQMLDSCRQEQDSIRKLIDGAGMAFGSSRTGTAKVRLELQSPKVRLAGSLIGEHGGLGNRSTGGSRGAIWLAVVVPEPFIDDLPVRAGPPSHHPSAVQLAADLVDALPR